MIRRRIGDRFLLISQHDHALLAGQIASHYGNARFAPPDPIAETLRAVSLHDCGWPMHDQQPTLNKNNLPLDVFETPLPLALTLWQNAVDQASAEPDYTQLLISLHVLGLSGFAASNPHTRREVFEINQFQQKQIETQEALRRRLNLPTNIPLRLGLAEKPGNPWEDQLRYNHNILQIADRISLALCCTDVVFPRIENITPRPGAAPVALALARGAEAVLLVEPWPFNQSELSFSVPYRSLPACPMASREEFLQAYAAAPAGQLALKMQAA